MGSSHEPTRAGVGRFRPSHRRRSHRGLERNSGPMCATPQSQPESTSPCPNSIVLRTTSRDPSSGVRAARGGHSRPLQLRARIEGESPLSQSLNAREASHWPPPHQRSLRVREPPPTVCVSPPRLTRTWPPGCAGPALLVLLRHDPHGTARGRPGPSRTRGRAAIH